MAENQPSMAELKEATNMAMADEVPYAITPEPEAKPDAPKADEPVLELETATPPPTESKATLPPELQDAFKDTPFTGEDLVKNVSDAVKSWKSTSSEYTKLREKVKPYEQLLDEVSRDQNLANFLRQAEMLYRNPQLASAYATPQGNVDAPPDPRQYDMYDANQYQAYQQALTDYNARFVDSRLNARLSQIEQQQKINDEKAKLQQAFPDVNPDEVLNRIRAKGTNWTAVDAYKALEYDNLKSKMLEEARKELTNKLETANKTTSPTPTGATKSTIKVADVIAYINKHGGESAKKKFGLEIFNKALREGTDGLD